MTPFVAAGAGFLLAVLWFDLMHDVQMLRHRQGDAPEDVLASIAAYYRRVTTDASPMNRLVGSVMLGTIVAVIFQLVGDDVPNWVAVTSLVFVVGAVTVGVAHTFRAAVRLGQRRDAVGLQSDLARSILRDHLLCLVSITALLVVQLGFGR